MELHFDGSIDNLRAVMQRLRSWKPSNGEVFSFTEIRQTDLPPIAAVIPYYRGRTPKDITPPTRATWQFYLGGDIRVGKSFATIEAYEEQPGRVAIEMQDGRFRGENKPPIGNAFTEFCGELALRLSHNPAVSGAEGEMPLAKEEIERLIKATLIREEIAFDRQETGGTIEFTVYRDDEVAGQFYAIDGDRFGVRQTSDTHAEWMTQIKGLIERQMHSRYSNGRDTGTKRLVEDWEAYAKRDNEIRQTIDIVRGAGGQLNQTYLAIVSERVQEAIRHGDMRRHKRWTELQAAPAGQGNESNNLPPPITNPTTERVWKAIKADPTLSDVEIGKQLDLARETVNSHRATLIQMTYPAKRQNKRKKV